MHGISLGQKIVAVAMFIVFVSIWTDTKTLPNGCSFSGSLAAMSIAAAPDVDGAPSADVSPVAGDWNGPSNVVAVPVPTAIDTKVAFHSSAARPLPEAFFEIHLPPA